MKDTSGLLPRGSEPVILLSKQKSRLKEVKKLQKRLRGSESFEVNRSGIVFSGQTYFCGIARWRKPVCITDGQTSARWQFLELHLGGQCHTFAIKSEVASKHPDLPGMPLSREERELLYDMASELRRPKDCRELYAIRNPERKNVKENRSWIAEEPDSELLSQMMGSSTLIPELCVIAVLTNLRPWLSPSLRPDHITNFVTDGKNYLSQIECLRKLSRSLNFTSEADHPLLIEITAEDVKDLKTWESIGNRMSLIHCGRKVAGTLRHKTEQMDIAKSAGQLAEQLSAQILLDSGAVRLFSCIDNIELPKCPPEIRPEQQEVLRRALARVLDHPQKAARLLTTLYREKICSLDAYRLNSADVWKRSAQELFVHFYPFCGKHFENAAEQKRQLDELHSQQLQEAISLILTPARYLQEIRRWPASYEDAKDLLDGTHEAVALVNRQEALCFTDDSLKRLTSRVGLPGSMFDALIDRLKEIGAIRNRTKSLHFTSGTNGRFVTISSEKFKNFSISTISTENGDVEL